MLHMIIFAFGGIFSLLASCPSKNPNKKALKPELLQWS